MMILYRPREEDLDDKNHPSEMDKLAFIMPAYNHMQR